jgi:UDP-N-acetyl-D-mannosaminuronic acid dehydrogenase
MKNKSVARILIVGLGKLGLPVAKYVKERGFEVYGYDVNPKAMDFAEPAACIRKASNFGEFDVYILCVSTHKPDDMFLPQIDGLFQTTDKISSSILLHLKISKNLEPGTRCAEY